MVVVVNVRRAAAAGLRFWDTTGVCFLGPRHVPACFINQIVSADGTVVEVIVDGEVERHLERGGCVKGSWKGAILSSCVRREPRRRSGSRSCTLCSVWTGRTEAYTEAGALGGCSAGRAVIEAACWAGVYEV